jgi:hypothetical protein
MPAKVAKKDAGKGGKSKSPDKKGKGGKSKEDKPKPPPLPTVTGTTQQRTLKGLDLMNGSNV